MKILFMTGREIGYPRNDVMLRAFRRFAEVDLVLTTENPKSLTGKSILAGLRSFPKLLFTPYDLVYVGFYGYLLMLEAGLLSRRPILFDAFLSNYDTLIEDRLVDGRTSLLAFLARWLDVTACRRAGKVLVDTCQHIEYFAGRYGLNPANFASIPVGCNEDIFFPRPRPKSTGKVRVIYYNSYLPLHGSDVVARAAARLQTLPIEFRMIGSGRTFVKTKALSDELRLQNVQFLPDASFSQLVDEITAADICLGGHFGPSEKAERVVPGKLYQLLAMKRAVLAGDTPANRDLLEHGKHAYLCPPGDPDRMAEAIRVLSESHSLRDELAQAGYQRYQETSSERVITEMVRNIVSGLTCR